MRLSVYIFPSPLPLSHSPAPATYSNRTTKSLEISNFASSPFSSRISFYYLLFTSRVKTEAEKLIESISDFEIRFRFRFRVFSPPFFFGRGGNEFQTSTSRKRSMYRDTMLVVLFVLFVVQSVRLLTEELACNVDTCVYKFRAEANRSAKNYSQS